MTATSIRRADARANTEDGPHRAPASVLVLLIGTFMAVLDFFIVNVAIPDMQRDLRASDAEIELVVAGYAVAYGSALIIGSRLGDRFGRKRTFLSGVGLFTAASAVCGFTPNAQVLVAARLVQGLAAALLSPQVLSIFGAELGASAKAHALVVYGFVMGVASVFAQLLGGLLIGLNPLGVGWRACFLINVPLGVIERFFDTATRDEHTHTEHADVRKLIVSTFVSLGGVVGSPREWNASVKYAPTYR